MSEDGFRATYGTGPEGVWAAPGRVNLIGEHTDYNDGFVMPFALPHATVAAVARRADGRLRLHTGSPDVPMRRRRTARRRTRTRRRRRLGRLPRGRHLGTARRRARDHRRRRPLREHRPHRRRAVLLGRARGRHRRRPQRSLRTRPGAVADRPALPARGERLRGRPHRDHGPDRLGLLHRGARPVARHPRPVAAPDPLRPRLPGPAAARRRHPGHPRPQRGRVRQAAVGLRGGGGAARRGGAAGHPVRGSRRRPRPDRGPRTAAAGTARGHRGPPRRARRGTAGDGRRARHRAGADGGPRLAARRLQGLLPGTGPGGGGRCGGGRPRRAHDRRRLRRFGDRAGGGVRGGEDRRGDRRCLRHGRSPRAAGLHRGAVGGGPCGWREPVRGGGGTGGRSAPAPSARRAGPSAPPRRAPFSVHHCGKPHHGPQRGTRRGNSIPAVFPFGRLCLLLPLRFWQRRWGPHGIRGRDTRVRHLVGDGC